MIAELGFFFLCCALSMACLQCVMVFFVRKTPDIYFIKTLSICRFHFLFILLSFATLILLFVQSDFSIIYVREHSHHLLPLQYKISASWSGHEGSMILWVFILALFSMLVTYYENSLPVIIKADVLAVQALISIAFYVFIIMTSNPFEHAVTPSLEGEDLNSALQDLGLAIHPPLLYFGYVGYSIAFSFAAAALINQTIDRQFAKAMKPWLMLAWIFLTLGIACGSYWAYYTLGWGGFWFWDPVENVSLLPWLAGTALLHSVNVTYKTEQLKSWTVFLSMLAFIMSLIGTFIVRSGILTSVHAFASDPERGLFILVIISFFVMTSLLLFIVRMPKTTAKSDILFISREGVITLNNLLLITLLATVFIGTIYPLIIETLTADKITVGAPYFNTTCLPLLVIMAIILPLGIYQAWIKGNLKRASNKILLPALLSIISVGLISYQDNEPNFQSYFLLGLAIYIMTASLKYWREKFQQKSTKLSLHAMTLAHIGIGIFIIGLAGIGWSQETILKTTVGQNISIKDYDISLTKISEANNANTQDVEFYFAIRQAGVVLGDIKAIRRNYVSKQAPTNIVGIRSMYFSQIYIALGNISTDGKITVRIYWKALVIMIWLGLIFMAIGGILGFGVVGKSNRKVS